MTELERLVAFDKEYLELVNKYMIYVSSCCCAEYGVVNNLDEFMQYDRLNRANLSTYVSGLKYGTPEYIEKQKADASLRFHLKGGGWVKND